MCRSYRVLCALAVLMVLLMSTVNAARKTTCTFNKDAQAIVYSITGGDNGTVYTVSMNATGCVSPAGTPPTLTGPNDKDSVVINCAQTDSFGHITVDICEGIICFDVYELKFRCDADGTIRKMGGGAPTATVWGISILLVLITLGGIYFARKQAAIKA